MRLVFGAIFVNFLCSTAVFAQNSGVPTDANGNPVAVNAVTSRDQVAGNYNGTFPQDGITFSSDQSNIQVKRYTGSYTYIDNGVEKTFEGDLISFVNPVTGVSKLAPGTLSATTALDGGDSYAFEIDNTVSGQYPWNPINVAYFEGNVANSAEFTSKGNGAEFILYKNYVGGATLINDAGSTFTAVSNFATNANISNINSTMYVVGNIASEASITNSGKGYVLVNDNKADGAVIYNKNESSMDILNNFAQGATIINSQKALLVIKGNNVDNAEIINDDEGRMTIDGNVASGAKITNRGTGALTIQNNNATGANLTNDGSGVMYISNNNVQEAVLDNKGGGAVFADNNTMVGTKVYVDGNSMSRFSGNTGENVELQVYSQDSRLYIYGNSFEGGLVNNNGTLIVGDCNDDAICGTNKTSSYTNLTVNNNLNMYLSGTINFEKSAINNSASGNITLDKLEATGGTVNNSGNIYLVSDSSFGNLYNAGLVSLVNNENTPTTLTVNGDYQGADGLIMLSSVLGADNSPTDFLHVTGNATGTTAVQVVNRGGLGALTTGDGIQLIKVDGTSSADNFSLKSDYSFEGQAAVVGGAYAYSLYAGNKAGDFAGDWYLRSLLIDSAAINPVYQPSVPMYEVYPQILQQLNKLGTLEQRIGNRTWIGTGSDRQTATINEMEGRGFWMKVEGSTGHINSNVSKTRSNYDLDMIKTQIGLDFEVTESDAGKLIGGA
ncbi:autotransporter outer membrane beta-barrel domain-containing protein, partial [Bartonella sp. LJL80]